jgi:hypothetical protein
MFANVSTSGTISRSSKGISLDSATRKSIREQTTRLRMVNTMLVAKRRSARRYTKAVGIAVSSKAMDLVKMNGTEVGIN